MSEATTATRAGGTARHAQRHARRWPRIALLFSLASFALATFPSLALAIAPYVSSSSATPSATGATLNASIYPYGEDTHYHFEYGPNTSYGTSVPVPDGDAGSAAYPGIFQASKPISGLTQGATYHYRLVASNSSGSATGPGTVDGTFTTTGTPPTVSDEAATEVAGGFELNGTVNPNGSATNYQFEYGTTAAYGSKAPEASAGSGSGAMPVSQTISSLLPSTEYHFRLAAHHPGSAAVFTADRTFMTPAPAPGPPISVVEAPIKVAGGYTLRGQVNPNNSDTEYHFELGKTTSYGTNLPPITEVDIGSGAANVPVSQEATGLEPNTTYHYRIAAHNGEGPTTSPDQTFKTAPEPPVSVSMPATESPQGFVLNGTVNANGGQTTYHFQFGITTAYGTSVPATDASAGEASSPVAVSQSVPGLPPGVPYHYRLVATNEGGTTMGEDEFFMTPPEKEAPPTELEKRPPVLTPPPLVPSNQFSVGAATPAGSAAMLKVSVPGAGEVSVTGKQLKLSQASSSGPGTVSLKLKLTPAGLKALKKKHKLKLKVTITYAPNGGTASSTTRVVTFKMKL